MDIVDDLVGRVRAIIGDNAEIIARIEIEEKEVRKNYGGENCYVSKRTDISILCDRAATLLKSGKTVQEVRKSTGLGRDRVFLIRGLTQF